MRENKNELIYNVINGLYLFLKNFYYFLNYYKQTIATYEKSKLRSFEIWSCPYICFF